MKNGIIFPPHPQVFFDAALRRPDLIEARWKCDECSTSSWNPAADERCRADDTLLF